MMRYGATADLTDVSSFAAQRFVFPGRRIVAGTSSARLAGLAGLAEV
jgi:hypothetical protein